MTDIVERLIDLHKQATTERSHYYVAKCCKDAIDEIERLRAASQWQPIETLPPIDLHVLLWCPDDSPRIVVGVLCDDGDGKFWQFVDEALSDIQPEGMEPTHWMPLPSPPTQEATE